MLKYHSATGAESILILGPLHLIGTPADIVVLLIVGSILVLTFLLLRSVFRFLSAPWRDNAAQKASRKEENTLTDIEHAFPPLREIEAIYKATLAPWLAKQESTRKLCRWVLFVSRPVGVISFFCFDEGNRVLPGIFILLALCAESAVNSFRREITRKFSETLAAPLGLTYNPGPLQERQAPLHAYERVYKDIIQDSTGGLRSTLEDVFTGEDDGVKYRLYKLTQHFKALGEKGRPVDTIFSAGTVFEATFTTPFEGHTLIYRDASLFGTFIGELAMNPLGKERVNLSYSKFEELYQVYGSSQVEARAILTPDLMEKLINITRMEHFEKALSLISFENNKMLMVFQGLNSPLPTINIKKPLTDPIIVRRFSASLAIIRTMLRGAGLRPYKR